jgi:hydroxymethylpyrimidine kinase/phosphomethylpyrimidine kinase
VTVFRDRTEPPGVLICSGLDPSGGAGFVADVRIVAALGARPVGVVTALTIQNTTGVMGCHAQNPEHIRDQLELLLGDVEVKAVKLGMLGSSAIAVAIGRALALTRAPVVWDPILYPSRGDVPLVDSLLGEAIAALTPHLALVTPNARELGYLTGCTIHGLAEAIAAGHALAGRLGAPVLVKGGHLEGDGGTSVDVLVHDGEHLELPGPRIPAGEHVHGTGCALSSAIAASLANGAELVEACRTAKRFVAERIARPAHPGRGAPAIV